MMYTVNVCRHKKMDDASAPEFGDADTPWEKVERFYQYWRVTHTEAQLCIYTYLFGCKSPHTEKHTDNIRTVV